MVGMDWIKQHVAAAVAAGLAAAGGTAAIV